MHEGDHGILDHDHESPSSHPRAPAAARRPSASRVAAGLLMAAAVAAFLAWRVL